MFEPDDTYRVQDCKVAIGKTVGNMEEIWLKLPNEGHWLRVMVI